MDDLEDIIDIYINVDQSARDKEICVHSLSDLLIRSDATNCLCLILIVVKLAC